MFLPRRRFGFAHSLVLAVLSLSLSVSYTAMAQTPIFGWAAKAGGTSDEFSRGIATDAEGNSYVTGSFSGTAAFGATNLTSVGGYDIFLAKYDALGNVLWVRQAGSAAPDIEEGRGVALDKTSHVYVAGGFAGAATFGQTNLVSTGGLDVFLAKYTVNGQLVWVRQAGGNDNFEYGLSIATDPVENVLVSGQFQGTANFGTTNLTTRGGLDAFLAKYDPLGNLVWITQGGGAQEDVARSVTTDAAGNSYISGWFAADATFGPPNGSISLTNAGSTDAFAAQYDSAGRLRWIAFVASSLGDLAYSFALDGATNGYLLAWVENAGGNQLGLYKFTSAGGALWSRAVRVNSPASARGGLAVDASGNSYFTSQFSGTAVFGTSTLLSQGGSDTFVAKYDAAGTLVWLKQALGAATEEGRAIALDALGNPCLTGWFTAGVSFDGLNLLNSGGGDVFVTRLEAAPRLSIVRAGVQSIVTWPKSPAGFELQRNGALPGTGQWLTVTPGPATVGGLNVITNETAVSNNFFRLRRP